MPPTTSSSTSAPSAGASPGSRSAALDAPHAFPPAAVASAAGVDPARGLSAAEHAARSRTYGPNVLERPSPPSWPRRFVRQFRSLLIIVLLVAAGVSSLIGEFEDAAVVGVVLLLNATIGTIQEARADRGVRALDERLPVRTLVRRDARTIEVDPAGLVPGDVVLVQAGERVPADGRLTVAATLAVDESSLTGESVPAAKQAEPVCALETAVADRTGMVFLDTTVVRGRGEFVVTATGMDTRMGSVARLLATAPGRPTPLQRQIDRLARRLAVVAAVAVSVVFVVALARGDTWSAAAFDAIALAIAAIPEGLPAVVTITLALGATAMARQRAIVRRLTSVETLGSTQVICTDKTGTLTQNRMTVTTVVCDGTATQVDGDQPTGSLLPPPPAWRTGLEAAVLCNDAQVRDGEVVGDPTEAALLVLAGRAGIDVDTARRRPRTAEVPFDAATKLMATLHPGDAHTTLVAVKGAPDVVLPRCTSVTTSRGPVTLDDERRSDLLAQVDELAGRGLRTLGVATRVLELAPDDVDDPQDVLSSLTFELVVGMVDPPRPGAADAIALAHRAGIRVVMVTGDHPDTAAAIAREVGIEGAVLTGPELDALDDDELRRRLPDLGVCARVAPEHKVRLVDLLQSDGSVTAMTGDGVNDAPALERADIGVAMGVTGTEVTRRAGDLILTDDDIRTIVDAVERGRAIYDNIVAFVRFQLTTNIGAIAAILGARLVGLPAPFTPIQVLWVNLIMDGPPALALGADPVRPGVMSRPPRDADEPILDRTRLRRLLLAGGVMAAGTLGVFAWSLQVHDPAVATSLAFTTFVLFQFANAVNARQEDASVFSRHTLRNGKLWIALGGVLALQVLAVHVPAVGGLVDVVPLSTGQWLLSVGVASTLLVSEELRKLVTRGWRRRA